MVKRPVLMSIVFVVIVAATAWGFVRQPTGFLPTEDQGYAIIVTILPEGASQPRSREVSEKVNAILRRTDGIDAWVTIGGLSILDFANVPNYSATFVVTRLEGTVRPAPGPDLGLNQLSESGNLIFVAIPPPIGAWARRAAG
jgi:HAE1 family hydrophobic/amphiphilic exporter-1